MTTIDVADDLDALERIKGPAKERVRSRLLAAEVQISNKSAKLSRKLEKLQDSNEVSDDEWIAKLQEYWRLTDMAKAIRERVLR